MPYTTAALLVLLILPSIALGQEPFLLSREVQLFAQQIKLAQRPEWKVFERNPPLYAAYDDTLTVFEVIAARRAEAQGRSRPGDADYQAAATAWCWWPNKPPAATTLLPMIQRVRGAVSGVYFLERKQTALRNAMGPLLTNAHPGDIAGFMTKATPEEYAKQIIDPQKIQ